MNDYPSVAPQAMREKTIPERLAEVSQSLGQRAQTMADAANRVIAARDELSAAQNNFDQTSASFRDAHEELRSLLAQSGVSNESVPTPAYR